MFPVAVRLAYPMELALIMGIADEAAKWMLEQGIKQWESPPPSECWALFREEIVAERVYFIMREGSDEVVGFFRLKWSGEPLWEDESNAGYLYSLAIRPRYIGQGIGPAVIKWLMQHFASLGKDRFRVDCIASNDRLRRWYEELGFKYRGVVTDGPYLLALYQRDLADGACLST